MIKFEQRNLASSQAITVTTNDAVWTDWSIANAVKDGYASSGWVYKAVSMISRNASTVPFVVKNADNEILWDHPITKLLLKPHPYLNRLQFYELLIQWLQLAGMAYMKKADNTRTTAELWPISPDRIAPIESKDNNLFVDGYETINENGSFSRDDTYNTDNVIQLSFINPAQPIVGIGPLQAAARAVDSDVAQQKWNVAAMQNRGVVEGVFTFKESLDKTQADTIMKRIMDKFSGWRNARKPLVIGSNATYTRLSLTAEEMDFLNSRNFNRDEIFVIFNIPPQLGGSLDASTYNNFAASMRIFWEINLIPLTNMMAAQFTSSFEDQLTDGYYIGTDLTGVDVLRSDQTEVAEAAKSYYDMGVPFEQLNTKFELGFEEFQDWDLPFGGRSQAAPTEPESRALVLIPEEKRSAKEEAEKRERIAAGPAQDAYAKVLDNQKNAVYNSLEKGEDPIDAVKEFTPALIELTRNLTVSVASQFANTVVVDTRGKPLNFETRGVIEDSLIADFLADSQYILTEVSMIQSTTVSIILDQLRNADEKGFNYEELRTAIDDTGVFSPERALTIARTEVGTAANVGQVVAAKTAGAEKKVWETTGLNTREAHTAREGEEVGIDERFSKQISSIGPRFPLDPQIAPGDRINCDCYMTFKVD